ncbi:MAG: leucine-rich repeat domain-containing protein [Acutalibacteraceae bacterium]
MKRKINEAAGVCIATAAIAGIVAVFAWFSIKQNAQPADAPQTSQSLSAQSDSEALSGTVGTNLTWQFDVQTATLTIDGEGDMDARLGRENRPSYYTSCVDRAKAVVIGDDVTCVAPYAFESFSALERVQLGKGVRSIGDYAFYDSAVEKFETNDALETIGRGAFFGCDRLEELWLSENFCDTDVPVAQALGSHLKLRISAQNPWYTASRDGSLYSKDGSELVYCAVSGVEGDTQWPDWEIPGTVTRLRKNCVQGNRIGTLTIPGSVTTLDKDSLLGLRVHTLKLCEGIREIEDVGVYSVEELVLPDSVTAMDENAFSARYGTTTLTFSENSAVLKMGAGGCIYSKDGKTLVQVPQTLIRTDGETAQPFVFTVPEGVERIAPNATNGLGYADSVDCVLPDSVTYIGDDNFCGMSFRDGETVRLPKNLKTIGNRCFQYCTLYCLTLPQSVSEIGDHFLEGTGNNRYDKKKNVWTEKKTKLQIESRHGWNALQYSALPASVEIVTVNQ